jgi:hypothetical protein
MKDTEDKDMALRGMRRAAVIARERASRFGLQIPVWRDGAIVFVDPKVGAQPDGGANSDSAPVVPPSAPSE